MSEPDAASHTLPLRNCYWVVPGLLLAGEHPNGPSRDKTKDRLKKLLGAGIECFVDLTKPTELPRYDTFLPFYVEYTRKSIKDHGTPTSRSQMVEILEHIANSMRAGRPVYVHCRAGIGRTGTVVGCLLAERGLLGNAAIDELNRLWQQCRRSRSWPFIPETDAQAHYVREWQPSLEGGFDLNSLATAVATVGSMRADGGPRGDSSAPGFGRRSDDVKRTGAAHAPAGASARSAGHPSGGASAGGPLGVGSATGSPAGAGIATTRLVPAGALTRASGSSATASNGRAAEQPVGVVSAAGRPGGIGAGLRAAAEQARAAVERGEVQVKAPPVPAPTPAPMAIPASAGAASGPRRASPDSRIERGEIAPSIRAEIAEAISGRSTQGTAAPNGAEEVAWIEAAAARAYARANGRDESSAESDFAAAEPTPRPPALVSRPASEARPDPRSGARSASEVRPDSRPGAGSASESHLDSRSGTSSASEVHLDSRSGASSGSEVRPDSRSGTRSASEVRPDSGPGARSDSEARRDSRRDASSGSEARTDSRLGARSDSEARPDSRAGASSGSEVRLDSRSGARSDSETRPDSRPDARHDSDARFDTRPGVGSDAEARRGVGAAGVSGREANAGRLAGDPNADARSASGRQALVVDEPAESDPLLDADTLAAARSLRERFLGTLFGLGVGDAVAQATQFRRPGTFSPVGDMLGGGPFDLPRGAWSDDTAMALCLAESLLERDGFDARDQVQRYSRWQQDGYMTSTGQCVGITASTARSLALAQWRRGMVFPGSHDPEQLDPEPLSRIAAVALFYLASLEQTLQYSVDSSRITCQAPAVLDACRRFGSALHAALSGQPKAKILAEAGPITESAAHANHTAATALSAAFWAFSSTDNYRDAVLRAANVGGNSDVVAAVCGQLAGAHYGATAIPQSWRNGLMEKDLIEGIADRLLAHALVSLSI